MRHGKQGSLAVAEAAEPEVNIGAKHELGIEGLDDDDKWMLDKNIEHLLSHPGCEQHN